MEFENVIEGKNIRKKQKEFLLDIPEFNIPKGFATALIGENGAGKTTLLNILSGIRLDYGKGTKIKYFNQFSEKDLEKNQELREKIGYVGNNNFFIQSWKARHVADISELLFDNFNRDLFMEICNEVALTTKGSFSDNKKIKDMSDGTKMKLALASVLARDTELLILDEPASSLDPLMRDKLCDLLREYISKKEGNSVLFSTHNISDMEILTDYAIIMENGRIAEQGFVDDLKEKYVLVKGEASDAEAAKEILYSISESRYGFEGICLSENIDRLAGMDIATETPGLYAISVAVMKHSSRIVF